MRGGWLVPTAAGLAAFILAGISLRELIEVIGLSTAHSQAFIDGYGEYQEGGSTRVGLVVAIIALTIGCWAAAAAETRRLDGGVSRSEAGVLLVALAALLLYALAMEAVVRKGERSLGSMPDIVFSLLDFAVLGACGYAGYWLLHRRRRL